MLRRSCQIVFLFLLPFVLSGCASTRTEGHKLAAIDSPIRQLSYASLLGEFKRQTGNPLILNPGEVIVKQLAPLLPERTSMVFALNGIRPARHGDARYELVLRPSSILCSGIDFHLTINTYIIDTYKNSAKIWDGEVRLWGRCSLAPALSFKENDVDELARDVLAQLANDGMVKLESGEIKLPPTDNPRQLP